MQLTMPRSPWALDPRRALIAILMTAVLTLVGIFGADMIEGKSAREQRLHPYQHRYCPVPGTGIFAPCAFFGVEMDQLEI